MNTQNIYNNKDINNEILKEVAMKITELPIVKQVYHRYQISKFKNENKNLDGLIFKKIHCLVRCQKISYRFRYFSLHFH